MSQSRKDIFGDTISEDDDLFSQISAPKWSSLADNDDDLDLFRSHQKKKHSSDRKLQGNVKPKDKNLNMTRSEFVPDIQLGCSPMFTTTDNVGANSEKLSIKEDLPIIVTGDVCRDIPLSATIVGDAGKIQIKEKPPTMSKHKAVQNKPALPAKPKNIVIPSKKPLFSSTCKSDSPSDEFAPKSSQDNLQLTSNNGKEVDLFTASDITDYIEEHLSKKSESLDLF